MYFVRNITDDIEFTCDAIETIRVNGDGYRPIEKSKADGFRALTIVDVDESTQRYDEIVLTLVGHTLHGTEPYGTYELIPPEEPETELDIPVEVSEEE